MATRTKVRRAGPRRRRGGGSHPIDVHVGARIRLRRTLLSMPDPWPADLDARTPTSDGEEELEMDVVDEQLEVIGKAVLGQTLNCARCHDHKFDPIPTRDATVESIGRLMGGGGAAVHTAPAEPAHA